MVGQSQVLVFGINIQGFFSSCAELVARLRMTKVKPTLIYLNKTFLNKEKAEIEGYELVGRRDRDDERKFGGVAVFAQSLLADSLTLMKTSKVHERVWIVVNSDLGPFVIGVWYRPPEPGETDSIDSLREEWHELSKDAVRHECASQEIVTNSADGELLHDLCADEGMKRLVQGATRGLYSWDLVLTDWEGAKCKVLPKVADHRFVHVYFDLLVPQTICRERKLWSYSKANWDALRASLEVAEWSMMNSMFADQGAEFLTQSILRAAEKCIPTRTMLDKKSTHPWVNQKVIELVRQKV